METIFDRLLNIFSLEYMFSVITASYMVIKFIDMINGKKIVPTWLKRVITLVVGGVLFYVFKKYTEVTLECLVTSFFAALFLYDTAIKVLLKKCNIDYRKENVDVNKTSE